MKIDFDRNTVIKILQRAGTVSEKKTTMPILGNLLLEARKGELRVSATDLELSVQSCCPAQVQEEGKTCAPAQHLIGIVRELPEAKVQLKRAENDWLTLTSGKATFRIAGIAAEEFPKTSNAEEFSFQKMSSETLRQAIERTLFAASTDEMRHNLNGCMVQTLKGKGKESIFQMVATDGHRLALFARELSSSENFALPKGAILPRKGLAELRKLLTEDPSSHVEVAVANGVAAFRIQGSLLSMKLVVGDFPDYSAVIPKNNKRRLMVNRTKLAESLKRVSLLSEGKSKCVKFGITPTGIHLAANSPELGEAEEEIGAEFDGEKMEIGFNARYVLDSLSAVESDRVVIELDHDQSPGIVRPPDDPHSLGVIMPMRI